MNQKNRQQKQYTQNEEVNNENQQESFGSKKQKVDDASLNSKTSVNQEVHQKFDQKQLAHLLREIKMIEEYYRMVSTEIKHQEDSISTLKPAIISKYPQLAQRKQLMIEKGKHNIKFIDLLIQPYKELLFNQLIKQRQNQKTSIQLGHTHQHGHRKYHSMTNLFLEVALQWGDDKQVHYFKRVLDLMQKYLYQICKQRQNIQKGQKRNMLVVGFGTGRILSQIKSKFQRSQINILLQGHESQVQHYIAAQYFLNNCTKQTSIYPYIHNFSNFIKQSSPYRELIVPFKLQKQSYYYPLTFGQFVNLYKSHTQQWDCLVTVYNNYHIQDVLTYIKMIYKILTPGAIWIDLCTANLSRSVIQLCYREYENILENSQFKLLDKGISTDYWYQDKECIMNEKRTTYYRVMQK